MRYHTFYARLIAVIGTLVFDLLRLAAVVAMRRTAAATSVGGFTLATPGEAPLCA